MKRTDFHNLYIPNCSWYRYLQGRRIKYDFTPLIDDDFKIRPRGTVGEDDEVENMTDVLEARGVDVMSGEGWPTFTDLRLDDSQYTALHLALTRELAVIQGPPGTG
jgi:hypothetical protein